MYLVSDKKKKLLVLAVAFIAAQSFISEAFAQDVMAKAAYLNTSYCQGVAEKYAGRMKAAGGSTYSSEARKARQHATVLGERAERLRSRFGFKVSEGNAAQANGTSKMAALLPASGSWTTSGNIPNQAFRQYQNCVTLAQ